MRFQSLGVAAHWNTACITSCDMAPVNNRKFEVKIGPHAPQLAIEAYDLSSAECTALRAIVGNNDSNSDDYKRKYHASPFLQNFQPPSNASRNDGWALVEFWCDDHGVIDIYVEYINTIFADRVNICEKWQG